MFNEQWRRHFPMPDYEIDAKNRKVSVRIYGNEINEQYTNLLKTDNSLTLWDCILENPLKVAPLIQSNLTPVKFFHSFILFILIFFVFFLSVMPGSTLNFVYKYNDSFLLLHLRSDSPKSSIRIA